jgi:flagellar biosynthesis protein FliR
VEATDLLVFARCAGFAFRAPALGHPSVPHALRAGFAVLLSIAIAPGIASRAHLDGAPLVLALAGELLVGAAMGTGASLLYDGAYAGGRIVDDYVGVKAIAPNIELVAPSGFGRVWSLAFTAGYVLFGAYRVALVAFSQSFVRIPPGAFVEPHAFGEYAMTLANTIVLVGASVAGPAIAVAFVTQIALAALARSIPRFSSFTLSFPLVFGVVLIATALAVPIVAARAANPILLFPGISR